LVCANQRSGSTLLCEALSGTGIAGHPEEYFLAADPAALTDWRFWEDGSPFAVEHGVHDRRSYLELVYRLGTTPNSVFGAKLMWNNVPWAVEKFQEMTEFEGLDRREVFATAFPNLSVIHLTRRDLVAQAVSWARAAQDGVWHLHGDEVATPTAEPNYDFDFIANLHGLLVEGEAGWRDLYDELGVVPHELVYEDMVADPEQAVRSVLDFLGLDNRAHVPPVRSRPIADALNAEWVERFHTDSGSGQPDES
jgi:LPS sulfotransferase NodH